ncbi:MAG TPA: response regulator [Planctomycetota bacterium]|jgi:CheY-like chemotaxis protein|nr:response regulator [Planctomycetota bacterium]
MGSGAGGEFGSSSVTPAPSPGSIERPSVLIVDDTPANLLAFSSLLDGEGYDLLTARSGPDALKLVLRREFAVILLDVRMPGMDGIETATFLRAGRGRYTPIIFVSAHDNTPHEVERGYLAGAIDYLFSPVDPELLRRKVSALVDFYLRTLEFKKRSDSLLQANQILLRKVASLEDTVAELRGRHPQANDTPAAR